MNRSHWILVTAVSVVTLGASSTAYAQDTGGTAGVGGSAGATTTTTTTPTPPPAPAATATTTTATTTPAKVERVEQHDDGDPDHEGVVGHFGVGYLGVSQLPIAAGFPGGGATTVARDNVNAPVIGVRYWLNRGLGLDLGVGFGITSGSTQVVAAGVDRSTDSPSRLGFAVHGGVPLAFAHGKHYSFTVIPEATVGFTSGTIKVTNAPDIDLSGFRLDLGGRVGAEIYFGFIGIPQLSLQGSVGLFFRREAWKAKQDTTSASVGETTFATSVQSDPWALFVNNISAFYYF
ncbi:MAG: hypothetical protein JWM74_146 [Myxococcaceae bacterium]|nr:hypothetical protein [Myxococcaceae bacterium]